MMHLNTLEIMKNLKKEYKKENILVCYLKVINFAVSYL